MSDWDDGKTDNNIESAGEDPDPTPCAFQNAFFSFLSLFVSNIIPIYLVK